MATTKQIGIFPLPLVHDVEAAKLKHLMAMRGVDSVKTIVNGAPAIIEVSSLELPTALKPDYTITADFNDDTMQLDAAPLATDEMETLIQKLQWHYAETG